MKPEDLWRDGVSALRVSIHPSADARVRKSVRRWAALTSADLTSDKGRAPDAVTKGARALYQGNGLLFVGAWSAWVLSSLPDGAATAARRFKTPLDLASVEHVAAELEWAAQQQARRDDRSLLYPYAVKALQDAKREAQASHADATSRRKSLNALPNARKKANDNRHTEKTERIAEWRAILAEANLLPLVPGSTERAARKIAARVLEDPSDKKARERIAALLRKDRKKFL